MRGYTKEERAGLLFTIPTTIFILAFFLIPTIQAILNSLRTGEGILSLDNYRYILSDSIFYLALTNTFYLII